MSGTVLETQVESQCLKPTSGVTVSHVQNGVQGGKNVSSFHPLLRNITQPLYIKAGSGATQGNEGVKLVNLYGPNPAIVQMNGSDANSQKKAIDAGLMYTPADSVTFAASVRNMAKSDMPQVGDTISNVAASQKMSLKTAPAFFHQNVYSTVACRTSTASKVYSSPSSSKTSVSGTRPSAQTVLQLSQSVPSGRAHVRADMASNKDIQGVVIHIPESVRLMDDTDQGSTRYKFDKQSPSSGHSAARNHKVNIPEGRHGIQKDKRRKNPKPNKITQVDNVPTPLCSVHSDDTVRVVTLHEQHTTTPRTSLISRDSQASTNGNTGSDKDRNSNTENVVKEGVSQSHSDIRITSVFSLAPKHRSGANCQTLSARPYSKQKVFNDKLARNSKEILYQFDPQGQGTESSDTECFADEFEQEEEELLEVLDLRCHNRTPDDEFEPVPLDLSVKCSRKTKQGNPAISSETEQTNSALKVSHSEIVRETNPDRYWDQHTKTKKQMLTSKKGYQTLMKVSDIPEVVRNRYKQHVGQSVVAQPENLNISSMLLTHQMQSSLNQDVGLKTTSEPRRSPENVYHSSGFSAKRSFLNKDLKFSCMRQNGNRVSDGGHLNLKASLAVQYPRIAHALSREKAEGASDNNRPSSVPHFHQTEVPQSEMSSKRYHLKSHPKDTTGRDHSHLIGMAFPDKNKSEGLEALSRNKGPCKKPNSEIQGHEKADMKLEQRRPKSSNVVHPRNRADVPMHIRPVWSENSEVGSFRKNNQAIVDSECYWRNLQGKDTADSTGNNQVNDSAVERQQECVETVIIPDDSDNEGSVSTVGYSDHEHDFHEMEDKSGNEMDDLPPLVDPGNYEQPSIPVFETSSPSSVCTLSSSPIVSGDTPSSLIGDKVKIVSSVDNSINSVPIISSSIDDQQVGEGKNRDEGNGGTEIVNGRPCDSGAVSSNDAEVKEKALESVRVKENQSDCQSGPIDHLHDTNQLSISKDDTHIIPDSAALADTIVATPTGDICEKDEMVEKIFSCPVIYPVSETNLERSQGELTGITENRTKCPESVDNIENNEGESNVKAVARERTPPVLLDDDMIPEMPTLEPQCDIISVKKSDATNGGEMSTSFGKDDPATESLAPPRINIDERLPLSLRVRIPKVPELETLISASLNRPNKDLTNGTREPLESLQDTNGLKGDRELNTLQQSEKLMKQPKKSDERQSIFDIFQLNNNQGNDQVHGSLHGQPVNHKNRGKRWRKRIVKSFDLDLLRTRCKSVKKFAWQKGYQLSTSEVVKIKARKAKAKAISRLLDSPRKKHSRFIMGFDNEADDAISLTDGSPLKPNIEEFFGFDRTEEIKHQSEGKSVKRDKSPIDNKSTCSLKQQKSLKSKKQIKSEPCLDKKSSLLERKRSKNRRDEKNKKYAKVKGTGLTQKGSRQKESPQSYRIMKLREFYQKTKLKKLRKRRLMEKARQVKFWRKAFEEAKVGDGFMTTSEMVKVRKRTAAMKALTRTSACDNRRVYKRKFTEINPTSSRGPACVQQNTLGQQVCDAHFPLSSEKSRPSLFEKMYVSDINQAKGQEQTDVKLPKRLHSNECLPNDKSNTGFGADISNTGHSEQIFLNSNNSRVEDSSQLFIRTIFAKVLQVRLVRCDVPSPVRFYKQSDVETRNIPSLGSVSVGRGDRSVKTNRSLSKHDPKNIHQEGTKRRRTRGTTTENNEKPIQSAPKRKPALSRSNVETRKAKNDQKACSQHATAAIGTHKSLGISDSLSKKLMNKACSEITKPRRDLGNAFENIFWDNIDCSTTGIENHDNEMQGMLAQSSKQVNSMCTHDDEDLCMTQQYVEQISVMKDQRLTDQRLTKGDQTTPTLAGRNDRPATGDGSSGDKLNFSATKKGKQRQGNPDVYSPKKRGRPSMCKTNSASSGKDLQSDLMNSQKRVKNNQLGSERPGSSQKPQGPLIIPNNTGTPRKPKKLNFSKKLTRNTSLTDKLPNISVSSPVTLSPGQAVGIRQSNNPTPGSPSPIIPLEAVVASGITHGLKETSLFEEAASTEKSTKVNGQSNHISKARDLPPPQDDTQVIQGAYQLRKSTGSPRKTSIIGLRKAHTFKCTVCTKSFLLKSELRKHVTENHSRQLPHACTLCHERFAQKSALYAHTVRHLQA